MTLRFSTDPAGHAATIVDMFAATFATSEGAEEGALIGDLARNFLHQADVQDVHVFLTWDGAALVGGCILSRLDFPQDVRKVYLL